MQTMHTLPLLPTSAFTSVAAADSMYLKNVSAATAAVIIVIIIVCPKLLL